MESARALAEMEKQRLMDLARAVPEALLHVGTTETVFASIKAARDLLDEDKWGSYDDADYPESPPSSSAGGSGRGVGGAPLRSTCGFLAGIRYDDRPPASDFSYDYACAAPYFPAEDLQDGDAAADPGFSFSGDLRDDDAVPVPGFSFSADLEDDDAAPASDSSPDPRYAADASGPDYWANLLAAALAPEGQFPDAYREITRLVSLHGEAGHVLFVCAARLGIQPGAGPALAGQLDGDAAGIGLLRFDGDSAWKRWGDLRASVVRHAHDALLRLKAAASAVAAAEDFVRWRSLESPGRNEWSAAARRLVGDARRGLDEAKESVRLMRDAVVREYFETWVILNRA
ncbi:hypothetical protein QOZ80_1BG0058980 [Eleusine coracana subsp. coracana]|nr:hypothetical protein QOZ80_1BG0058980 [Eleusine coracana subsp. coracana]